MSAMLTSSVPRSWPLILLVFELTFPTGYALYNRQCYPVGNREVCFFRPQPTLTWVTWSEASDKCKGGKGTLPIISDKLVQDAFEKYLISLEMQDRNDLWMAGQEARKRVWSWVNGAPFTEPPAFNQTVDNYKSEDLQVTLRDGLVYKKDFLYHPKNYVCQFFGAVCQSKNSIALKNGCVLLNNGSVLNLYDARNECVERGGDLAVIDGQDDLNKFQQVLSQIKKSDKVWIGLRRQWWMWSPTDAEVKYSHWISENGYKPDLGCMVVDLNQYLWKQQNCSAYFRFVCQTGPTEVKVTDNPKTDNSSASTSFLVLVVGISIPVVTILLVSVIVIVIVMKRKARQRSMPRPPIVDGMPREMSYQHLEHKLNEPYNSEINQHYDELKPMTRMPLPTPPTDRPMQSQQKEKNPDYYYEEIGEIGAPNYLEVIR